MSACQCSKLLQICFKVLYASYFSGFLTMHNRSEPAWVVSGMKLIILTGILILISAPFNARICEISSGSIRVYQY